MLKKISLLLALCLPTYSLAQPGPLVAVGSFPGIHFWTALIGGILLAFGFQLVLTSLSAGVGISAINVSPKAKGRKHHDRTGKGAAEDQWSDTAIKIESGAGIFALITTSIALFFAAWFAVQISRPVSIQAGAVMGLIIWAAFLFIMLTFESRMASSALGSIMAISTSMFKATFETARDMLQGRMARKNLVRSAEDITAAVRREMMSGSDLQGLKRKIEDYLDRQQPSAPSVNVSTGEARRGFALDMNSAATVGMVTAGIKDLLSDKELLTRIRERNVQMSREDVRNILDRHTGMKKDQIDAVIDTVLSTWNSLVGAAGQSQQQAQKPATDFSRHLQDFKNYLRSTGRSELDPNRIEAEIKILVSNPKEGIMALRQHAGEINHDSIVEVVHERRDISDEEANRIADQIVVTYNNAVSQIENAADEAQEAKEIVLRKLDQFFDTFQAPDFDYDGMRRDFMKLFADPRAGYDALKTRLEGLDRETLLKILTTNKKISREKADHIIRVVEDARDDVLAQAQRIKDETARRIEEARVKSLEQIDQGKKVMATAAWWLFAIVVVSGAVAAIGGALGARVAT